MSLTGKRVIVTRAVHQAGPLADMLRTRGAKPVLYPTIEVLPSDDRALRRAVADVDKFDWLVITSRNTAYALGRWKLLLNSVDVAAVGEGTAEAVREYMGVDVDFVPDVQLGEVLAKTLPLQKGMQVFLPQSGRADLSLAEALERRGADVTVAEAYRLDLGDGGDDVPPMIDAGKIDAVTFTSASTVENFTARLGYTPKALLAGCIGPSTAETAREYGYEIVCAPEEDYSLLGLVGALGACLA